MCFEVKQTNYLTVINSNLSFYNLDVKIVTNLLYRHKSTGFSDIYMAIIKEKYLHGINLKSNIRIILLSVGCTKLHFNEIADGGGRHFHVNGSDIDFYQVRQLNHDRSVETLLKQYY